MPNNPKYQYVGDSTKRRWVLLENWIYEWEKNGQKFRLVIPAGTITDKASVPQIVWSLGFTPDGLVESAALPHDFLYHHKGRLPKGSFQTLVNGRWVDVDQVWSRLDADRLFLRIMKEAGVPLYHRRLFFRAVRIGGWFSWRN